MRIFVLFNCKKNSFFFKFHVKKQGLFLYSSGVSVKQRYSEEHKFLHNLGFPRSEIDSCLNDNNNNKYLALNQLFTMLKSGLQFTIPDGTMDPNDEELIEMRMEEVTCLETM